MTGNYHKPLSVTDKTADKAFDSLVQQLNDKDIIQVRTFAERPAIGKPGQFLHIAGSAVLYVWNSDTQTWVQVGTGSQGP